AYLLASLGGNTSPSAADIKKILGSVGISVEDDKLEKVLSELKGKDINMVIEAGKGKLVGIPTGGVGGAAGAAAATTGGDSVEAKEEEEKKEEEKAESSDSDEEMGFDIFGD
ncbi:60S acidic ribosomal protein P2, partial [Salmonella sp. s54412]